MNFVQLPKIDLHCHLDGSVRYETMMDLIAKDPSLLDMSRKAITKEMVTVGDDCQSLYEYLKCFAIPIAILQTSENLSRIAYELLEDAANENVKYIEIRFAPLIHTSKGLSVDEVIKSVLNGMRKAERIYEIKGNIILSFVRGMDVKQMVEVMHIGKKYIGNGVVAVDLCANEPDGFAQDYQEATHIAQTLGYKVTIHAGETGFGRNVLDSIELLKADRIGHGVAINKHPIAYQLVKSRHLPLEMCPTSNVQTKAVSSFTDHPLYNFYKDGINVTINTDNRTVSNTTMTSEIKKLIHTFNLNMSHYKQIYLNSVNASFADQTVKDRLLSYLVNIQKY